MSFISLKLHEENKTIVLIILPPLEKNTQLSLSLDKAKWKLKIPNCFIQKSKRSTLKTTDCNLSIVIRRFSVVKIYLLIVEHLENVEKDKKMLGRDQSIILMPARQLYQFHLFLSLRYVFFFVGISCCLHFTFSETFNFLSILATLTSFCPLFFLLSICSCVVRARSQDGGGFAGLL